MIDQRTDDVAHLHDLFVEREHSLDQLTAFRLEHEAILNQYQEMTAAAGAIDAEIRKAAAAGNETEISQGRTTVTIKRKAAPKSYDADALLAAWPALAESHPRLFSRHVDSRALQALVKKGKIPEVIVEAALKPGKKPAPSVTIETLLPKQGDGT